MKEINSDLLIDPPARASRIQRFLKPYLEEYGTQSHIDIRECPICGYLKWVSTSANVPDGQTYSVRILYDCYKCLEIQFRDPEVYKWIMMIMRKRDET